MCGELAMKPKIETKNGETIVCLGDYNCVKWAKGKERQSLSILNAGCYEAKEILTQLGYNSKTIAELTGDLCGCPQIDQRFCKNPDFVEFIKTWRPMYIPYNKYPTLTNEAKELVNELMRRGYITRQTCCVQYDEECKCVKTEDGFFITARVIDYDKCIKWTRNECVMTVRQAITEVFSFLQPKVEFHREGQVFVFELPIRHYVINYKLKDKDKALVCIRGVCVEIDLNKPKPATTAEEFKKQGIEIDLTDIKYIVRVIKIYTLHT